MPRPAALECEKDSGKITALRNPAMLEAILDGGPLAGDESLAATDAGPLASQTQEGEGGPPLHYQ